MLKTTRLTHAALLVAATALACGAPAAAAKSKRVPARHHAQIKVLSTRADLVSAGDALTQIVLPKGTRPSRVRVTVGKRDVTGAFKRRANGKFEGLLTGLANGANRVVAHLPGGYEARLTVRNHPQGGPVFAGPQIQPWKCQAGAADAQCNAKPSYTYLFEPATGGSLQPYDPSNPPPAGTIATATTTEGVKVPFIVRQETGYVDRDQYAIATLFQPGKPWKPWKPQPQYNGRLVITHGFSCDTEYGSGTAPSVQDTKMLGGGFVLMSNALDNAGHNCNITTQAESLEMTKEWMIDHYGEVRWTIGSGCSGGSLAQQQVANAYPGIYQGISPQCSFTDAWSSAMEYEDYVMLLHFFEDPTKWDLGDVFGPTQIQAIIDHPNPANPVTFTSAIPNSGKATRSCPDVPDDQVYNAQTNPHGVRCTLQDYMVNVFGRRPSDGFANRAFDNVGIQYGLKGLRQGLITPSEFVDLNEKVGGFDIDGNFQAGRAVADQVGLERAYRSGAADEANNLDKVAIIDLRGPDPGAFHDVYRTYAMRARLMRNFGTAANQVLWRGQAPLIGDSNYADDAVFALDGWLARV
ncbi:MAG: hypothetical protein QOE28_1025, partial [Solirubrobacteraceae bacterium]|nr:hypothetical protein [Solirubrobacteraceae bacterium]